MEGAGPVSEKVTKVGCHLGYKKNIGDFSNIDVQFWVEDYVRDGETTASAMARVEQFVDDTLGAKMTEIANDLRKKNH